MTTVYQNKYCRIVSKDTIYIIQIKADKYNAQYFFTLPDALEAIGVTLNPAKTLNHV